MTGGTRFENVSSSHPQVLHGDIVQVNVWDSHLAEADVKEMAACRFLGLGNIFSSDTFDVEIVGDVQQSSVGLDFLCRCVINGTERENVCVIEREREKKKS